LVDGYYGYEMLFMNSNTFKTSTIPASDHILDGLDLNLTDLTSI